MNLYPRPPQSLIGLDVQPHAVRLVRARRRKEQFVLEWAAMGDLPPGTFAEGKIRQWNKVSEVLSSMLHSHDLQGATVVINLPMNVVRMQRLQLPAGMTGMTIVAEINAQIQRDIPGLSEALSIDYVVLEESAVNTTIFFVAARQDYILQFMQCVNAIGMRVTCVDVDILSLARVIGQVLPSSILEKPYALIYATAVNAALIFWDQEEMLFQLQWHGLSTDALILEIKKGLQLYGTSVRYVEVNQWVICAEQVVSEALLSAMNQENTGRVLQVDPSTLFTPGRNLDMTLFGRHRYDFLMACGAVMRDVPKW